jgi:uncharacterized protein YcfJ
MSPTSKRALFCLALLSAGATTAWATEFGTVISSSPVVVSVAVPRQECADQPVTYQPQPSGAGALIGGIAGAAIGNSIGGGFGRAAATGLGLFAGSVIGNQAEANSAPPVTQTVRQCRTVTQYENRTVGYDVVYDYQGMRHQTRMAHDPGARIALNVNVAPAESASPAPPDYSPVPRAGGDYAPAPQAAYPGTYYPAPYYAAPYYAAPYYAAPYYGNVWPAVGVGIAIGGTWGGHGHRH